jgi:hypothetical protein
MAMAAFPEIVDINLNSSDGSQASMDIRAPDLLQDSLESVMVAVSMPIQAVRWFVSRRGCD